MKKYNLSLDETGQDDSPLLMAVQRDVQKIASYLISNGADVNVKDKYGRTPIYYVESLPMLEMLLENGADVHIKDNNGKYCYNYIEGISKRAFKDSIPLFLHSTNYYPLAPYQWLLESHSTPLSTFYRNMPTEYTYPKRHTYPRDNPFHFRYHE